MVLFRFEWVKEMRSVPLLKNSRWLWLRSQRKMTGNQRSDLAWLSRLDTRTGKAYQIKLTLQRLWNYTDRGEAETFLKKWYFWATHSRLEPVIEAANTIRRHWQGILQFVDSRITTGIVEGLNSKIKTAMKRAYGFKSFEISAPSSTSSPARSTSRYPLNVEENHFFRDS